jgi:hypothetical protein
VVSFCDPPLGLLRKPNFDATAVVHVEFPTPAGVKRFVGGRWDPLLTGEAGVLLAVRYEP